MLTSTLENILPKFVCFVWLLGVVDLPKQFRWLPTVDGFLIGNHHYRQVSGWSPNGNRLVTNRQGEIRSHQTPPGALNAADPTFRGKRLLPGELGRKFRAGGVAIVGKREQISGDCSGVKTEVRSGLRGEDPSILAFCVGDRETKVRQRSRPARVEEIRRRLH
ncbi:hypothetical protein TIFTF001_020053 [Ficus carica]|uniref:Uncharacterized protein n=1 Tax=Ficus carica TaxID=3494 RepID=A0AA88A7U1_FICCA|nr:hypothetical protein TIFTF001_020053 [Ficus carica]